MAVNKRNMTFEELEEYNRQYIRKLRENPEYRQKEKEYSLHYREANKDKINARMREKITCSCGCTLSKGALSRHKKESQQHINSIQCDHQITKCDEIKE